jgi:hypothetical protein
MFVMFVDMMIPDLTLVWEYDLRDSMIPTDETHENIWAIRKIPLLIGYFEELYCLISVDYYNLKRGNLSTN